MNVLIAFPLIISFFIALISSPRRAFLAIYLPLLILLPMEFDINIKGLPPLSFAHFAIIPILPLYLILGFNSWKWSIGDLLVICLTFSCFYSEYINEGLKQSFLLLSIQLVNCIAPYMLAKGLLQNEAQTTEFSKRLVFLIFLSALISLPQLIYIGNPIFSLVSKFFYAENSYPVLFRFGLPRIQGPPNQSILFGVVISIGLLINYWLLKKKIWSYSFKGIPELFVSKGKFISIILLVTLLFTISFTALGACLMGFLFVRLGFSKFSRSKLLLLYGFLILLFIGIYAMRTDFVMNTLQSPSEGAISESVAYRLRLEDSYKNAIDMKPYFGWGSINWPRSEQGSIDNAYIFMAVVHGLISLFFFGCIIFRHTVGFVIKIYKFTRSSDVDLSLYFLLLGLFWTMNESFLSVWMGNQLEPIFFMLAGWAETYQLKLKKELKLATYTNNVSCK